jgi:hypothetical protein
MKTKGNNQKMQTRFIHLNLALGENILLNDYLAGVY